MNTEEAPEPRPGEEPVPPRRRRRPQELWARETEPYPGALALWDLEEAGDEDAATILARFTVARCVAVGALGGRGGHGRGPRARRDARAHVRLAAPAARRALGRLLYARPGTSLYRALRAAGLQAADAGHAGGAYTFLRLAYEVAAAASQRLPAARVAAHLARLAAADDAPYSARFWSARVRGLLAPDARTRPALAPAAPVPGHALVPYVAEMSESHEGPVGGGYDAEARRTIQAALGTGAPLTCPACGAPLAVSDVPQPSAVSYVRRRVWVLCTGCRRTASLDVGGRR